MKWNSALVLTLFLLSLGTVSATNVQKNCTDSYAWENITWYFNGTEYSFNSKPIYCKYGCADNGLECAEPMEYNTSVLTIGVILALVAFIFAYLAKNITWGGEKFSWPLQVLFLFVCIFFILINVGLMAGFSTFTQNQVRSILNVTYMGITFILWLTLGFFMILLIIKSVEYMLKSGERNAEK